MTIESNGAFRLTPEQLAAAARAREYWASRHDRVAQRSQQQPGERVDEAMDDAESPQDERR